LSTTIIHYWKPFQTDMLIQFFNSDTNTHSDTYVSRCIHTNVIANN